MGVWAIAAGAAVFALDQWTKSLVRSRLGADSHVQLLPFLKFEHVQNTGIAFGLFSGAGVALMIGTVVVAVGLVTWLLRLPGVTVVTACAAGSIGGGALGNLVDRARQGSVTDFITVPHWPTFNVADSFIVVAVVVLLIHGPVPGYRRESPDAGGGES